MILNTQTHKNIPTVSGYVRLGKQNVFYTNGSEYKEDHGETTINVALNSVLVVSAIGDYSVTGGLALINYGATGMYSFDAYRVTGDFRIE